MSDGNLQADEIGALIQRLGFGAHCVGEKVLYVRRVDLRWSPFTRVKIEHVIQESIDLAVKSFTNVLQAETRNNELKIRREAYLEEIDRTKKAVRAALYRERQRVKKRQAMNSGKGR